MCLVTYGSMSREPLTVGNGLPIFRDRRMSSWYKGQDPGAINAMFRDLVPLLHRGDLRNPVERIYPLDLVREAVAHASRDQRAGKILLRLEEE